jgi:hypothetical protein
MKFRGRSNHYRECLTLAGLDESARLLLAAAPLQITTAQNDGGYFVPEKHPENQALTAGPSTTLRSGRDDKSVAKLAVVMRNHRFQNEFFIPTGAHPDFLPRSTGQGSVCAFP